MRAIEFISEEIIDELNPGFINSTIKKQKEWKKLGAGYTASVWEHYSKPGTVVKVLGGGEASGRDQKEMKSMIAGTLAFVHFCVDHGHKSKHLPIIHGINIDDDEVLQVRIERLKAISYSNLAYDCADLADGGPNRINNIKNLDRTLRASKFDAQNSATDIAEAIKLLKSAAPVYAAAHRIKRIKIDLHVGNWLMRADRTIVAADPWVSFY